MDFRESFFINAKLAILPLFPKNFPEYLQLVSSATQRYECRDASRCIRHIPLSVSRRPRMHPYIKDETKCLLGHSLILEVHNPTDI